MFQIKAVWSAMCDRHMGAKEAQVLCRSKGFGSGSQLGADVSDLPLMSKHAVETLFYGQLTYITVEIPFYSQTPRKVFGRQSQMTFQKTGKYNRSF